MSGIMLALALTTQTFSLPPGLLSAVCYVESKHNPHAFHKDDGGDNSLGLCQLHKKTARFMGFKGSDKDLLNPKINSYYAGKYLRYQLNRYNGNVKKALAAYNAGKYRINRKGQIMNRHYVNKVLKVWVNTV